VWYPLPIIERLPHWIRWVLTPVAAVVAFLAVNLFFGSIWMLHELVWNIGPEGIWRRIVENIVQPGASGFLMVQSVYYSSPSRRTGAGLVCGSLIILVCGASLLPAIAAGKTWSIVNLLAMAAGSVFAIYDLLPTLKNSQIYPDKAT